MKVKFRLMVDPNDKAELRPSCGLTLVRAWKSIRKMKAGDNQWSTEKVFLKSSGAASEVAP
jgi:hypothetical protein